MAIKGLILMCLLVKSLYLKAT